MTKEALSSTFINGVQTENSNSDIYPFYITKNKNLSRCSSMASLRKGRHYRVVKRLVRKNGKSAIKAKSSTFRSFRFMVDISNTLIESHWGLISVIVLTAYFATWFMFAGVWMVISRENMDDFSNDTCFEGINGFWGYFLFSVETQSSIGFGGRNFHETCPETAVTLCAQIVVGECICGSLICIVYLKMIAPRPHRNIIGCFSRKAVICQREGALKLVFRVRDPTGQHEAGTKVAAYLAQRRGGELHMRTLKLSPSTPLLLWPVEITHRLDENSPLWDLSAEDLLVSRFEIILVLEGSSLTTSYMSETTTSYLSKEILWGYKFKPCTTYDKELNKYIVDHSLFNATEEIDTPLCSSHHLKEVFEDYLSHNTLSTTTNNNTTTTLSSVSSPLLERASLTEENEEYEDMKETKIEIRPQIRRQRRFEDDSSHTEDDYSFMDISMEDVRKKRLKRVRKSSVSDKARNLLYSLQNFVSDENRKSGEPKRYTETDF